MFSADMFLVISASLLFGFLPGLTRFVQLTGVSSDCVVLWTYGVSFCFYILSAIIKKQPLKGTLTGMNLIKGILIGAVGMAYTTFFLNLSYRYIPTGMTILLHFTYPVLVAVSMSVFYREPFTREKRAAGLFSMLGMLFVTGFTFSRSVPGIAFALLSAACYSFYLIMGEKSSIAALPVYPKMAAMALGAVLVICVQMAIRGSSPVPPSPLSCIGLTAIGLLNSIAFALMTSGVRAVGSTKASFASMLEPVTSVLCGILFFSEPLKGGTLPGLILILISMKIIAGPGQQKLSDRRAHRYNFR